MPSKLLRLRLRLSARFTDRPFSAPSRNALLKWYSLLLLRDYRRIFGAASEAGQLDNITRRFAWFRRVLKSHEEENAAIFPPAWNVGAVLTAGFSEVTK